MTWYDTITDIDLPNEFTSYIVCLDTIEGDDVIGH